MRDLGSDGRGHAVSECGRADGIQKGPGLEHGEVPLHPVVEPGLVVDDDGLRRKRLAEHRDEAVHRLRVARPPNLALGADPRRVPLCLGGALTERGQKPAQPVPRIPDDAHARAVHEADDGWIDVEMNQRLLGLEVQLEHEALGRPVGEAAADGQHDVGLFQRGLGGPVVREHAQPERVGFRNGTASHHRRDDGSAQPARQRGELGGSPG